MSADAGADGRAMETLQATVKDLSARLVHLEAKVAELSESPMDRAHRGLAEAAACLPTYAEHLTQAEVAERRKVDRA